jgi:hypothetical protein
MLAPGSPPPPNLFGASAAIIIDKSSSSVRFVNDETTHGGGEVCRHRSVSPAASWVSKKSRATRRTSPGQTTSPIELSKTTVRYYKQHRNNP